MQISIPTLSQQPPQTSLPALHPCHRFRSSPRHSLLAIPPSSHSSYPSPFRQNFGAPEQRTRHGRPVLGKCFSCGLKSASPPKLAAGCGSRSNIKLLRNAKGVLNHICRYAEREPGDVEGEIQEADLQLEFWQSQDSWKWNKTARELVAYGLLLAAVPIVPLLPRFEFSGACYFLFLALWSVYVGSHRSLGRKPPQRMTFKQGLAAPIVCSVSLFGFYCLVRFFPDIDLRLFISAYLGLVGALAVASNLVEPLRYIFPETEPFSFRINFPQWLVQDEGKPIHMTVTAVDCVALLAGVCVSIASKQVGAPFTLNNFIAVCIVTELLQLLSLGSFATAAAMLCGLLIYDVFWVFGSSHVFGDNVMVTVATSTAFEGPMKLIFPQWKATAINLYSVLGLGDLAAPGLLIALMLRFDRSRSKIDAASTNRVPVISEFADEKLNHKADKTYFVTCMASYIFGLTLTIVANSVSGAAQPALLYLVPSLFFGVFLMASFRSEASLLLNYKDEIIMSSAIVNSSEEVQD